MVEITPEQIVVRRGKTTQCAGQHESPARQRRLRFGGQVQRFDCLHDQAASNWGKIDLTTLESMLDKSSQGNFTMQSMIFEPSTRVLYLATGNNAPKHTFQRIELQKYFAHE